MGMTVAVISALPRESAAFFELPGEAPVMECGITWATREVGGVRLVAATAGMGTTNTAATTQFLVDRARLDAVVFCGIAGSLNPLLGMGDVVVGARLCRLDADMAIIAESAPGLASFVSDARLVELAARELRDQGFERVPAVAEQELSPTAPYGTLGPHGPRFVVGAIATSDLFSTEPEVLAHVRGEHAADCEEMEGAAAAQVAARAGLPFLAVRSISNVCGEAYDDLGGREEDLTRCARLAARVTLGTIRRL